MVGLLWLLAAVGVLGTSYPLATWTSFLKSIDSNLPLTTLDDPTTCYYFDHNQECSETAIRNLLSLPTLEIATWAITSAHCESLLDAQRIYAEKIASVVFEPAITSSGVTDFELLAQSWVLRAGYHPLTYTYQAFVAAINDISDWSTVHCEGANLLYDSETMAQPDFFESKDCDVLDTLYASPLDCTLPDCTEAQGVKCCGVGSNTCCNSHYSVLWTMCFTNSACPYQAYCCTLGASYPCCTGSAR